MAKKSRRARKAEAAKMATTAQKTVAQATPEIMKAPEPEIDLRSEEMNRKAVTFTQDYYYVYTDVRILAAVTVVMIGLMIGLSFVI